MWFLSIYFHKLKQCLNLVKNATIACVECVCNLATMDEEFHAIVECVEYKLLVKTILGLEVQWKDKQQQKMHEFINKKMAA